MRYVAMLLVVVLIVSKMGQAKTTIGYLPLQPVLQKEDSLALEWLQQHQLPFTLITAATIKNLSSETILWIHHTGPAIDPAVSPELAAQIRAFYTRGGHLLLTGTATRLVAAIGLESMPPETRPFTIAHPEFYQKRGLQSYRGHPLFYRLFGGTYLWQPVDSVTVWRTGYFASRPQNGKGIAIEKAYVRFLPDTLLAWEYQNASGGHCVAIGAYIQFQKKNILAYRMNRLLTNAFEYLNGKREPSVTHWPPSLSEAPQQVTAPESRLGIPRAKNRLLDRVHIRDLHITQEPATNNFWDVGGRRILVMGKQQGGIDEIWAFPYRIIRHWQVAIYQKGKPLIVDSARIRFTQMPEAIQREYVTPTGELREMIYAHRNAPGVVVHYQWTGEEAVDLHIRFSSDLRWFWPYREDARANLQYAFDPKRQAFYLRTADGDVHVFVGADQAPAAHIIGVYRTVQWDGHQWQGQPTRQNEIAAGVTYSLNKQNEFCVNVAVAAARTVPRNAEGVYRAILVDPQEIFLQQQAYYDSLLTHSIRIETPDSRFNEGYQWALVALDRFKIYTPGIGAGLMAGFGTTERGWDGGHTINGRPGYAWYFGRDAAWAALALIANGDTTGLRNQLRLFARFQDESGKIFHELTPNGVVHYDAADATPLFVILAGRYLEASGDSAFLREIWPHVERAMQFMAATDTDSDGLINNYQVGHGWVEGGPLFGGKTTFYLAGLWQAALQNAATIAKHLGYFKTAKQWHREARRVSETIQQRFYLKKNRYYAQSISLNNKPLKELSILPAAVMNLMPLPENRVDRMLMVYASTAFTTDWGARILSRYSPHYHPRGYHSGSVWPLFTGWLSLAEYRYGNEVQAFQHLNQTLRLFNHQALGFIEEVFHGNRFQAVGVCAHQAWSESAVLNPIYYGLLGLEPHALTDTLFLTPRIPGHWDKVVVRNIRIGETRLDLEIKQGEKRFEYKLFNVVGKPVTVVLKARMPLAARLKKVTGVKTKQNYSGDAKGFLSPAIPISVAPERSNKIKVHYQGGILFFPAGPHLQEGQLSTGLRILAIRRQGNRFEIDVECKGGHDQYLGVHTFRSTVKPVKGAFLEPGLHRNDYWLKILSPKFTRDYIQKTVILEVVND